MSSRFFAGAGSSSDDDDYSSSFGESGDEQQQLKNNLRNERKFMATSSEEFDSNPEDENADEYSGDELQADERDRRQAALASRRSRFLIGGASSSSESEDDQQRVVKSQRERAMDEVAALISKIGDAIDDEQWTVVLVDLDRLLKVAGKALAKHGPLPDTFHDFIDFLLDVEKSAEQVKELKADEARAFNTFKHKLKKIGLDEFRTPAGQGEVVEQPAGVRRGSASLTDGTDDLITSATVSARVQEIMGARGRKRAAGERTEMIAVLKRCLAVADTAALRSQCLVALLSAVMDWSGGSMSIDQLDDAIGLLESLRQALSNGASAVDGEINYAVSYGAILQRCDDEFTLSLLACDHHSPAYLDFCRLEGRLIEALRASVVVLQANRLDEVVLDVQARLLDRLYYRQSAAASCRDLLVALYNSRQEPMQMRALLCHVHILSVQGRFEEARDLLTASHAAEHIHRQTIGLQILYNRSLVQLGLAAFRLGRMTDAYFCLQEVCASGRPKELLGQSMNSHQQKQSGRQERLRQVPHHLHVNIELVDTVFSVASILLELPQAACQHAAVHSPMPKKVFQSRHLKRIIESHERSLFNGPPENSREMIVAACRALWAGDWRRCRALIVDGVKLWGQLTGEGHVDALKAVLAEKIQMAACLIAVYAMAGSLATLRTSFLAEQFELKEEAVAECLRKHSMLLEGEGGVFSWKDDGKQIRKDHLDFTMNSLRGLLAPLVQDGSVDISPEYLMYGKQTAASADIEI